MKILVIGSGGREHTLVWKLKQSDLVEEIFVATGNAGTAGIATNLDIRESDTEALIEFVKEEGISLTVVGPEAPLVDGVVDAFESEGLRIFGPRRAGAMLEGSKVFSKDLMKKYNIPTAEYQSFDNAELAMDYIREKGAPIVVKAEGLAAGKGVIVAQSEEEALEAVRDIMLDEKFGASGERIVIEEFLDGEECTVLSFTDGETIVPMIPSQDHKAAYDGDKGPNTGGMGAYAPAPIATQELMKEVYDRVLVPTIEGLKAEGIQFKGILYSGLMITTKGEIKVIEYNVRFGDPEAQVVLPLLETDLVEIIEAVIDERLNEVEVKWKDKVSACVIMASGGYPLDYEKGKEITGIENVIAEDTTVFQAGVALKDGKLLTNGGRVLGVTALGDSYKEAIDKSYQGVKEIDFADVHYRNDIGHRALNR